MTNTVWLNYQKLYYFYDTSTFTEMEVSFGSFIYNFKKEDNSINFSSKLIFVLRDRVRKSSRIQYEFSLSDLISFYEKCSFRIKNFLRLLEKRDLILLSNFDFSPIIFSKIYSSPGVDSVREKSIGIKIVTNFNDENSIVLKNVNVVLELFDNMSKGVNIRKRVSLNVNSFLNLLNICEIVKSSFISSSFMLGVGTLIISLSKNLGAVVDKLGSIIRSESINLYENNSSNKFIDMVDTSSANIDVEYEPILEGEEEIRLKCDNGKKLGTDIDIGEGMYDDELFNVEDDTTGFSISSDKNDNIENIKQDFNSLRLEKNKNEKINKNSLKFGSNCSNFLVVLDGIFDSSVEKFFDWLESLYSGNIREFRYNFPLHFLKNIFTENVFLSSEIDIVYLEFFRNIVLYCMRNKSIELNKYKIRLNVNDEVYKHELSENHEIYRYISEVIFLMSFFKSFKKYIPSGGITDEEDFGLIGKINKFYEYILLLFGIDVSSFKIREGEFDFGIDKSILSVSLEEVRKIYTDRGFFDYTSRNYSNFIMKMLMCRDMKINDFTNSILIPNIRDFSNIFLDLFPNLVREVRDFNILSKDKIIEYIKLLGIEFSENINNFEDALRKISVLFSGGKL